MTPPDLPLGEPVPDAAAFTRRETDRIAVLDDGSFYHCFTLDDPTLRPFWDRRVRFRGLTAEDLAGVGTVVVPCRTNPDRLAAVAPLLQAVLDRGDRLVAMGETEPELWLPGIDRTPMETNFWWWLEEGGDLGLSVAAPDHPLFDWVDLQAATWHLHGRFAPPPGAVSLIDAREGGSILYEDRATWPGTLLITSLDPVYHHGSFFMPAASRFLKGFWAYLRDSAVPSRQAVPNPTGEEAFAAAGSTDP